MGCHPILRMDATRQGPPSIYHKASLGLAEEGPVFPKHGIGRKFVVL